VILADTSIWIDFFRSGNPVLRRLLDNNQVVMHSCLVAELALGSLHNRPSTLAKLDSMPHVRAVDLRDVRQMIEARKLYAKGIGLTDTQLLASCLTNPGTLLWTKDHRLDSVAASLGIKADLPLQG